MRSFILFSVLALVACSSRLDVPPPALAPAEPVAAPEAPVGEPIEAFLARFQNAVRSGDAGAVAHLAHFPIAGAEVPDRQTFVSEFYPTYLGERDGSFAFRVLEGTPDDLQLLDDGRYQFVSLDESCEEDNPDECFESAMIFFFAPDGETWVIDEILFAG